MPNYLLKIVFVDMCREAMVARGFSAST